MLSYTLTSKPAALALYRMLPATLSELRTKSGMSKASCYALAKYLLVVRQAHVSGWSELDPVFSQGAGASVPRPSPEETELVRRIRNKPKKAEYMKAYTATHKEERQAYRRANKDSINKTRQALAKAKEIIKQQQPSKEVKTSWVKL
jgi:hypothetical protein